jgi:HTH-type transcriptional regulator/antitoxin HipB
METTKKIMSLDQLKDKHLGEVGTIERDKYEFDLKIEILGDIIKSVRKERHLTQEQLGEFKALKANVKFSIEMNDGEFKVA